MVSAASQPVSLCSDFFQGQYKFKCPALVEETMQQCGKVWSYQEVRRLAVLTAEEMQHFEKNIARLAASQYCDFKPVSVLQISIRNYIQLQSPAVLNSIFSLTVPWL